MKRLSIIFLFQTCYLVSGFSQSVLDSVRSSYALLFRDTIYSNYQSNIYLIDSTLNVLNKLIINSKYTTNNQLKIALDSVAILIPLYDSLSNPNINYKKITPSITEINYSLFRMSLPFSDLDLELRAKAIFRDRTFMLYKDAAHYINNNFIISTYDSLKNCEEKMEFIIELARHWSPFFMLLVGYDLPNLRNCEYGYYFIMNELKGHKSETAQRLFNAESEYLINNLDTSNSVHLEVFRHIIKGEPTEDELRRKELSDKDYAEQRFKLDEIQRKEMEEREKSIEIDFNTLSDEDKLYYMVYSDTTLWENGYPTINNGDDAMRFDTFSNAYLINLIRNSNYSEVYDSLRSSEDFNINKNVIHLRKIFQILGDRNTFGSYTPSPQDTGILYTWVDKYYDAVLHSSYPSMQDEAADQILRLWRLVYPRWVGWLKNENLMERALIKQRIIYMLNEELILDLIARVDAVYTPESPKEAHILADPLLDVFYGVVIPEHLKSTRRPSWSAVDAQRWVDDYIVPALKRWKYFGF
jgi:hypothetical protein